MFLMQPIGYVRSPYQETREIPKGLGAKHEAEGLLEIRVEFEPGLTDIEGFSHLFVIWAFDRSEGYELVGAPPTDDRPHGVFATRSPTASQSHRVDRGRAPQPGGPSAPRPRDRYARRHADPRHQALPFRRPTGAPAARLAGGSRSAYPRLTVSCDLHENSFIVLQHFLVDTTKRSALP